MIADAKERTEVYATLAGRVDDAMVQRVLSKLAQFVNDRVRTLHLMLHSTGGIIGDGFALYNVLRNLPIDITIYNTGTLQSIAVIVFLSSKRRKASSTATFMIHKATFYAGSPVNSLQLNAATQSLLVDDGRIETVLKESIRMPEEKWNVHRFADLFMTADQALEYGLIDEIADFSPPPGAVLVNI